MKARSIPTGNEPTVTPEGHRAQVDLPRIVVQDAGDSSGFPFLVIGYLSPGSSLPIARFTAKATADAYAVRLSQDLADVAEGAIRALLGLEDDGEDP